jgi:8-hydroxy-5-deazaflavin:NADPH oxidoreductase
MRIGVIGAGSMGRILASHLARLGHQVSIANSRGPDSLSALAAGIGARPVSITGAAEAGDIVVIAIPTKAVADLPRSLLARASSQLVIIDIGNYIPSCAMAALRRSTGACSTANGSRSRSGVQ